MTRYYSSPAGVENAIKAAAKKAVEVNTSLNVNDQIQLEYFNRFLSRVFSEGDNSEWVLKGGTGMLARIPSTRSTRDIDLYKTGFTLSESLEDLIRLAAKDLHDYFHFEYVTHEEVIDNLPYVEGYRVTFDTYIGPIKRNSVMVDLAVGAEVTGKITNTQPKTKLEIPKLASYPYRIYPIVDQIADKVCATITTYNGKVSSREKDLVDLVVLANTQNIKGSELYTAIVTEMKRRQIEFPTQFEIPPTWGAGYKKFSKTVPYCKNYKTIEEAKELIETFINPVLQNKVGSKNWLYEILGWD
ncbi:MAG: nucleotidyl transferase AbiEii/AbiGii toxin family protein [Micrococcaceae bacterium]